MCRFIEEKKSNKKGLATMNLKKVYLLGLLSLLLVFTSGCVSNQSDVATSDDIIETKVSHDDTTVKLKDIPEYAGKPAVKINGNKTFFTKKDKSRLDAFETYSNLDSLGRCGVAYANICKELMPTEERGQIGQIKPSGWQTAKYNGCIEGNYLYNRCHLIGFQLAGENANEKNLITGTRYMNCDGQLPYEDEVADYVQNTGNHVLYRVTPIYDGNNLLASGVLTEAYSVEDKGKGVEFCVYCYNVQPGISINYENGDSTLIKNYRGEYAVTTYYSTKQIKTYDKTSSSKISKIKEMHKVATDSKYILNESSKKFHNPNCSAVKKMSDTNIKKSNESRSSLIGKGYSPCGICNP